MPQPNLLRALPISFFLVLLFITTCFGAEEPIVPPTGGQDVLTFTADSAVKFRKSKIEATANWVPVKEMPFSTAYQVDSNVRYSDPKNMRVVVPIDSAFKKGDVMLLSFWIRRPKAGGQPNNVYLNVQAGVGKPRFQYKLGAYRAWQQHVRSFVAATDYDPKQSNVTILLGEAGTMAEIAELRLVNYGADYDIKSLPYSTINYKGRDAGAQWRKDALARIEKIRKGDKSV